MAQLLANNNAGSSLAGSISNTSVTANLQSGSGALFPHPAPGQYFVGTFTSATNPALQEIVWVTNVTGDTITMTRAQEGTTALSWNANDLFDNLITAGSLLTMVQAYQAQQGTFNYAVDTGLANAYVCGLLPAVASAPPAGLVVRLLVANGNTGASTLNAGWGIVTVVRRDGSPLIGGEMLAGMVAALIFDGTHFQLQGIQPATAAAITAGTDGQSAVTPAQLANASFAPSGTFLFGGWVNLPAGGFYYCHGGTASRTTDAPLFNALTRSSVVTLSIASPGVVNWTAHGLSNGMQVSFETTGSLPTGLSIATNYYVVAASTNSFEVAATVGGSAINFTGSQSGTQTCRFNPFGCGDGLTTFGLPDLQGRTAFGADHGAGRLGGGTPNGIIGPAVMGASGGEQNHAMQTDELTDNTPTFNAVGAQIGILQNVGSVIPVYNSSAGGQALMNVTNPGLVGEWIVKR